MVPFNLNFGNRKVILRAKTAQLCRALNLQLLSSVRYRDYSVLRLVVLTFLGGVLNSLAIKMLGDYYSQIIPVVSITSIVWLIVAGVLVFLLPIGVSLLLSGRRSQIIPPLYIQILTFGFLTHYTIIHPAPTDLLALYTLIWYVLVGGLIQDRVVLSTIGRYAPRDQILPLSLRVNAELDVVKDTLLTRRFREYLGLRKKVEPIERGYRLRGTGPVKVVVDLRSTDAQGETRIDLAFYKWHRAYYCLRKTDEVEECARSFAAYLKDILQRHEPPIVATEVSSDHWVSAVDSVIDEMQGLYSRMGETPATKVLAVIATIALAVVTLGFFVFGHWEAALATLAVVAYLVFEVRRLLKEE